MWTAVLKVSSAVCGDVFGLMEGESRRSSDWEKDDKSALRRLVKVCLCLCLS